MDNSQATQVGGLVQSGLEAALPVLLPFHPLISLVRTAILAHFFATGQFPSEEQIRAAIPADLQTLEQTWADWKPSGDGTVK